jgi:DNA/RNA-binding domain of Phe-tRNA-synthetase-like protein
MWTLNRNRTMPPRSVVQSCSTSSVTSPSSGRGISGGTIVRFARGDERWADLGSSQTEHPEPGEVIFADEADVVSARRWCWRQSAGTAAREGTTEILVTVEGHHGTAEHDVTRALADLEALLVAHAAPAALRSAVLSARA